MSVRGQWLLSCRQWGHKFGSASKTEISIVIVKTQVLSILLVVVLVFMLVIMIVVLQEGAESESSQILAEALRAVPSALHSARTKRWRR